MAKDMGGFLSKFAGGLGGQLGGINPVSGLGLAGNPLSGIGMLQGLMGGGNDQEEEDNPGMRMFKGGHGKEEGRNGFLEKFGSNLSDQLFKNAMMGFMDRGPY